MGHVQLVVGNGVVRVVVENKGELSGVARSVLTDDGQTEYGEELGEAHIMVKSINIGWKARLRDSIRDHCIRAFEPKVRHDIRQAV